MKAGIFLASDFKEGNGANARIKAYAKGLKEKGVDVEILFLHASSFNNTLVNNQNQGFWNTIFYKFLNNRVTRPSSIPGKILDSLRSIIGSTYYILKNRKQFDIFFLYTPKFHQFFHIFLLSKLLGITTVVEKTELYSALFKNSTSPSDRLLRQIHLFDETYCHRFCDHLVVISRQLYNFYRQYFPEHRITLLPIIVDMERFTHLNGHPKKPYRIGYLGSFGEKDGVPGIIEAFSRIHSTMPDLKLRLIGYNPQPETTEAHLSQHKLNGSVENLGQVKYSDIPDLLHECDLLVVNRTNSPYAHYGFPTKLGEYLATGRPTIVTNVGDIPHYLEHKENTYFVDPEDTEALAKVFQARYEHYDYFNRIGENGKKATQQLFDYRIHVKQLYCLLNRLVNNKIEAGSSETRAIQSSLPDNISTEYPTVPTQLSKCYLEPEKPKD